MTTLLLVKDPHIVNVLSTQTVGKAGKINVEPTILTNKSGKLLII